MVIFIYSRKSKWTGRGESVENQLAMCRDYIQYNIEGAGEAEIVTYEDEGYSGKNTNRPQFQKMMQEIKKGRCNYLVCYKLDRLGRNIADLANLVETLNKLNVSFISIKEKFDTSTPIGKAMLYFAGVLAQMEREQIAERVRDNMVMLARKGRWLGGNTPLGFAAEAEEKVSVNGKSRKSFRLAVDEQEMQTVRFIFREYLKNQSLMGIVKYFLSHGIQTKRGNEYTTTAIRDILTNPVYCTADKEAYEYFWNLGCQVCMEKEEADGKYGLIAYAKTSSTQYKNKNNSPEKWIVAKGKHPGIISGQDFSKIQNLLAKNSSKGEGWHKPQNPVALLSGILYCSCGHLMRPKYYSSKQVTESGERKFSYLCPYKGMTHGEKCSVLNVQGNTLDELVCREVLRYTEENSDIHRMLKEVMERMDDTKEETVTAADLMEQEIQKRKKEVQNLISVLAKSGGEEAFIQQIEKEIRKLNEECAFLEKERTKSGEEGKNIQGDRQQMEVLLEQLSSFRSLFDTLTVPEKREYLRMILDKVVWDGKEAHIFIYGSH
ncbi:recombinase family protein [Petralouisia muris]|uniref:Recombinase family protein n=1 Tax=Petralouisia muris TaxID=3032872 RepID=A0AC61RZ38_9FIRM|nr:recombinase family protein [Petralouisia muris]TGY97404.1 recombinase family protein [Petralouisia muris]